MASSSTPKTKITPYLIGIALGVLLGYLLSKGGKQVEYRENVKVEYQDRIEYRDRIVEKVVKDTSSDKKQNVRVITKYIERPDGTKEMTKEEVTDTHETEATKTVADKTQDTEMKREVQIQTQIQTEYIEKPVNKDWHLSASGGLTSSLVPIYGAQIERRILGPVFVGIKADTNPSASLTLGMEF